MTAYLCPRCACGNTGHPAHYSCIFCDKCGYSFVPPSPPRERSGRRAKEGAK